jgi:hypothetical protein
MRVGHDPSRIPDDGHAVGHINTDDCSRTYRDPLPYPDALENDRSRSDQGALADFYVSAHRRLRADVGEVTDSAVVVDIGSGVDKRMLANSNVGLNDCAMQDDSGVVDDSGSVDLCGYVPGPGAGRWQQPIDLGSFTIPANRDHERSGQCVEHLGADDAYTWQHETVGAMACAAIGIHARDLFALGLNGIDNN